MELLNYSSDIRMPRGLLEIKVPTETRLAFVGDIHENKYHFDKLLDKISPNNKLWLISVGDIYDKGRGEIDANYIVDKFRKLNDDKIGYIVPGNHELKKLRMARKGVIKYTKQLDWISKQPLCISFTFSNRNRITVLHGGVAQRHTWRDLSDNTDICYIRELDDNGNYIWVNGPNSTRQKGTIWHKSYDGRFGYIVSGHFAQIDGIPKFYNYSCNIDTACYKTGILTCQLFDVDGNLDKTINITNE